MSIESIKCAAQAVLVQIFETQGDMTDAMRMDMEEMRMACQRYVKRCEREGVE